MSMGDIVAYCDQIEKLLEQKRTLLDTTGVKKLRDSFQAFQIYYENIFNTKCICTHSCTCYTTFKEKISLIL